MNFWAVIHILLQVIQAFVAIGLVWVVTSQTSKDQGMGGAIGGSDGGGGSRYKGGYEEKLDDLARNLVIAFLVISFIVPLIGHNLR